MKRFLKWLLPPSAPPARQIPIAILRAAILGAIAGPVLGIFFGWSGPVRAVIVSMQYSVFFYSICALPTGYVRQYYRNHTSRNARLVTLISGVVGVTVSAILMIVINKGTATLDPTFIQPFVVVLAFALAWGQVIATRDRLAAERELTATRAQTKVLQAQMNPHFFFNTLNTVSALIPENPTAAQRTVGLLSDMSRYAFCERRVGIGASCS